MNNNVAVIAVLLLLASPLSDADAKSQRHAKRHVHHSPSYAPRFRQPEGHGSSEMAVGAAKWWERKQGGGTGEGGGGM
jgi:hypothetical protein